MPYKDIKLARLANRKSYYKYKEKRLARQRERYRLKAEEITKRNNGHRKKLMEGQPRLPKGTLTRKLEESNNKCAYCGLDTGLGIAHGWDHVLPLSRGGRHIPENIVRCCEACNKSKGNKTLSEWLEMKSI